MSTKIDIRLSLYEFNLSRKCTNEGPTPARDLCFAVPSHVDEFDGVVGSHTLESLCQDASVNTRASRYIPVICSELDLYIPRVRTAIGRPYSHRPNSHNGLPDDINKLHCIDYVSHTGSFYTR